jgi:Ca-activated chloride channel family protein
MTFLEPLRLALLLGVMALLVAYLWAQRRRKTYALRFSETDLLASVAPRAPGWRRHVPAALLLGSMVLLTTGFAQPEADVEVPREQATVMVAIDTSVSMRAQDVVPSRDEAARQAAASFVEQLPDRFRVGLVQFAGSASVVVPPTHTHADVTQALDRLQLAGGTAIGDAVLQSIEALAATQAEQGAEVPPARLVLLSDGANTSGTPLEQAAQAAAAAQVPVSTIAFGTPEGRLDLDGRSQRVPADAAALGQLAEQTGGLPYTAASGEELTAVYDDIGSSIGTTVERQDVSSWFAGAGLLLAASAAVASLFWFARLP